MTFLPRTTPLIPKLRINRSRVQPLPGRRFAQQIGREGSDILAFTPQNVPNLSRTVKFAVVGPSRVDLDAQGGV